MRGYMLQVYNPKNLSYHRTEVSLLKVYEHLLVNEKFFLRPIFPGDHVALRSIFTNSSVMKYFGTGRTFNYEEIQSRTMELAKGNLLAQPSMLTFGVFLYKGCVGRINIVFPKTRGGIYELSYCICPAEQGKGLATLASRSAMEYIGGDFEATMHPANLGSKAVLTKLGFKPDPTRQNVEKFGAVRDYYIRKGIEL